MKKTKTMSELYKKGVSTLLQEYDEEMKIIRRRVKEAVRLGLIKKNKLIKGVYEDITIGKVRIETPKETRKKIEAIKNMDNKKARIAIIKELSNLRRQFGDTDLLQISKIKEEKKNIEEIRKKYGISINTASSYSNIKRLMKEKARLSTYIYAASTYVARIIGGDNGKYVGAIYEKALEIDKYGEINKNKKVRKTINTAVKQIIKDIGLGSINKNEIAKKIYGTYLGQNY